MLISVGSDGKGNYWDTRGDLVDSQDTMDQPRALSDETVRFHTQDFSHNWKPPKIDNK